MFDDPQVQAEAMVTTIAHPTLGSYRGFTQPWVYSRTPGPEPFAAPTLGQHSSEVKAEAAGD
jgi:formyl-CoA transferase